MSDTSIQITAGSGTRLRTYDRSVGGNTVHEEVQHLAESQLPTYVAVGSGISAATSSDHVMQLMAGSSLYVRIRRIQIQQAAQITTAQEFSVSIIRLSTAGTGGSAITPRPYDTGDAAAGATSMSLPSAKGTEGVQLDILRIAPIQTYGTGGVTHPKDEWIQLPGCKPLIIPPGTSNGVCLKVSTGRAGLTIDWMVEFVETSWL